MPIVMGGIKNIYSKRLKDGLIKPDAGQAQVVAALDDLAERLDRSESNLLKRLFKSQQAERGLYIHGAVGRGKTMLMDMFFEAVRVRMKRRIHFHAFMQDIHRRRSAAKSDDVIALIAEQIAGEVRLLCLDEMQIVDIADAMIIGRLYDALLAKGVTLVTTSNLQPEGLYQDGLNRQLFLPFIAKLRDSMDVVALDSPHDYRLGRISAQDTYLWPATAENRIKFNALWNDLTDEAAGRAEALDVLGRKLLVPKAARGCAAFTFGELCANALGPPDYLAIADAFRTVFVSGIKRFEPHQRNEAKRFILMIDTFYDQKIRLVALSDVAAEDLQPEGHHAFEFQRTVSRLKEMQAESWWTEEN